VGWTLYLILLGIVCAVVVIWLAEFLSAQHRPPDLDEQLHLSQPMHAVAAFLAASLPPAAEMRLEPRGNYNLQIYVEKSSLESVPVEERDRFVMAVTQAWCENLPTTAFLSFVQLRDLHTGDELATARCPIRIHRK
jgi:hypothetical protein